jgi:hypothetical protein
LLLLLLGKEGSLAGGFDPLQPLLEQNGPELLAPVLLFKGFHQLRAEVLRESRPQTTGARGQQIVVKRSLLVDGAKSGCRDFDANIFPKNIRGKGLDLDIRAPIPTSPSKILLL